MKNLVYILALLLTGEAFCQTKKVIKSLSPDGDVCIQAGGNDQALCIEGNTGQDIGTITLPADGGLDVTGDLTLSGDGSGNTFFRATTQMNIGVGSQNTLRIDGGNTEHVHIESDSDISISNEDIFWDDSAGMLGVHVGDTPAAALHVDHSGLNGIRFDGSSNALIRLVPDVNDGNILDEDWYISSRTGGGDFVLSGADGSTDRFTLTQSGAVTFHNITNLADTTTSGNLGSAIPYENDDHDTDFPSELLNGASNIDTIYMQVTRIGQIISGSFRFNIISPTGSNTDVLFEIPVPMYDEPNGLFESDEDGSGSFNCEVNSAKAGGGQIFADGGDDTLNVRIRDINSTSNHVCRGEFTYRID